MFTRFVANWMRWEEWRHRQRQRWQWEKKKNCFPPIYRSHLICTRTPFHWISLHAQTKKRTKHYRRARSTRSLRAITHCLIDFQQVYQRQRALMSHRRKRETETLLFYFCTRFFYLVHTEEDEKKNKEKL